MISSWDAIEQVLGKVQVSVSGGRTSRFFDSETVTDSRVADGLRRPARPGRETVGNLRATISYAVKAAFANSSRRNAKQMTNLRVPLQPSDDRAQWQNPCDTKRLSPLLVTWDINIHRKVKSCCPPRPWKGRRDRHRQNMLCECRLTSRPRAESCDEPPTKLNFRVCGPGVEGPG